MVIQESSAEKAGLALFENVSPHSAFLFPLKTPLNTLLYKVVILQSERYAILRLVTVVIMIFTP